jgi:Fe2+ transport system protein FeoA
MLTICNIYIIYHDKQGGNSMVKRLSELKEGERGIIQKITGNNRFQRRLREMGFVKGTEVLVEKFAPLTDPIELVIMDYHLSLRREEAGKVVLECEAHT